MYRPQSLDEANIGGVRRIMNDRRQNQNPDGFNAQKLGINYNRNRMAYINEGHTIYNHTDPQRYNLLRGRAMNFDRQITNVMRQNDHGGISQSQSFSHGPLCYHFPEPLKHGSRLSTYMSPPSPHWTTVGNIMAVKRSTSMPGSKPSTMGLGSRMSPSRINVSNSSIKKKCGPFQCLKYQFRKAGHKNILIVNENETMKMTVSLTPEPTKMSKSIFKKKPVTTSNIAQNSSIKYRGIRKSISLLFSKSNRSSKSDPNIVNQKEISPKHQLNYEEDQNICPHNSRRNRSYESMLESGDVKLSSDTNKSYSYSNVQESSTLTTTNEARSVDAIMDRNSPSEMSLSDSASVCSSEQLLSSQSTSYYGKANYKSNDTDWKTVVGNVCRSNSKDSAIANSTLSGDGNLNQSKRISLTSTISKMSDLTSASDDFNDSSYSSFNDLQITPGQVVYSKPRILTNVNILTPIHTKYATMQPPDNSDTSPSSDSSTETLRPMSHFIHRRYFSRKDCRSSHSNTITTSSYISLSNKTLKRQCFKRSHSWPGCNFHMTKAHFILKSEVSSKPPLPSKLPARSPLKYSTNFLKGTRHSPLKLNFQLQKSRLTSSPLLSQYSRLYSLRTSVVKDPHNTYHVSGQQAGSTQVSLSPRKHVKIPSVFLRSHNT